jgi:hypothetical protein
MNGGHYLPRGADRSRLLLFPTMRQTRPPRETPKRGPKLLEVSQTPQSALPLG